MYGGYGFRPFEIGDVDVIKVGEEYHLFHLVLPNHDYIAHAVSRDGLHWRRVKNALFISDPEAWDDDMLWTMHVSPSPYRPGWWRMFYTGLAMRERGRVQRIGLAHSADLYTWHKDTSGYYPLELSGGGYESRLDEGRRWVSFRDPFFIEDNGARYLLAAARVSHGPIIRRGCVALAEEVAENRFVFRPPLFHPRRYDDIEVPNLLCLEGRYYLIGSIREDVKVHYWYAEGLAGPYRNFGDNVLMPQGNYAARICRDGERVLIWNFFFKGLRTSGHHLLPPPKELVVNERGELRLRSFAGFDAKVTERYGAGALLPLEPVFGVKEVETAGDADGYWVGCSSGMEIFVLPGSYRDVRLSGTLSLDGAGKCGLVLRLDAQGDGYYLSLDLAKGLVQIRAWHHNLGGGIEEAFRYEQLQGNVVIPTPGPWPFALIAYGDYLELSLGGEVVLTLADDRFAEGRFGFYVESAHLRVSGLRLELLASLPDDSYSRVLADQVRMQEGAA